MTWGKENEITITVPVTPFWQRFLGVETERTKAYALGDWCYHVSLEPSRRIEEPGKTPRHFEVTHIPTGHNLGFFVVGERDARRLVEALQGLKVETVRNKDKGRRGVDATPQMTLAFLDRILAVADGMKFGEFRPGDVSVKQLRQWRDEVAAEIRQQQPEVA